MSIIQTPQILYHGTTDNYLSSFQRRLLDSKYWRPGRDFGEGFYTTISPAQARKWSKKMARASIEPVRPCVLEIRLDRIPEDAQARVFLSESLLWAAFIFAHRTCFVKDQDPCGPGHPDVIIGPMADNDTGKIVMDTVSWKKDVSWFYERITRTSAGKRLDALHLGSQVVFSSEKWASSLCLVGFYIFAGGRWQYHEHQGQVESV